MFRIEVRNPIVLVKPNMECEDLRDAIEEIFPMETEDAVIFWNGIPVLLSYKYDICILIDDILPMLESLQSNMSGQYSICFPSNSFRVDWEFEWQNGFLKIDSFWHEIKGDKAQLNKHAGLKIELSSFLTEWEPLLQKIISSLELSQVIIKDHKDFTRLCQIKDDIFTSFSIDLSEDSNPDVNMLLTESDLLNDYDENQIFDEEFAEGFSEEIDKYSGPRN